MQVLVASDGAKPAVFRMAGRVHPQIEQGET